MTKYEMARNVVDEARDGIAWLIVYREGRGWKSSSIWLDVDHGTIETEGQAWELNLPEMKYICHVDPYAIIVNTYYYNFGEYEHITIADLAEALNYHYLAKTNLLRDVLYPTR